MNLIIEEYDDGSGYYIAMDDRVYVLDEDIINRVEITLIEYQNISRSHNCILNDEDDEILFISRSDAEEALEDLIPYLIFNKLTE